MKPRENEELSKSLKEIGQIYRETVNAMNGVIDAIKPVKRLVGNAGGGDSLGSKMITIGVALISFPDPTLSDVVGAALVTTGALLNRMRGPSIMDIFKEVKRINADIKKFYEELLI